MQNLSLKDFADTGLLPAGTSTSATTLHLIESTEFASFHDSLSTSDQQWLKRQAFTGKSGQVAWLENGDGVIGAASEDSLATLGGLPYTLPEGVYRLSATTSFIALLGWGLGSYSFDRYKAASREPAQLILPDGSDAAELVNTVAATYLTRDLINTPAQDMTPSHLQA